MLTLEDAKKVIAAAEKKANALKQPMNIAVADAGGNLIAHVRMDDAWMGSIDISIKKAFTARAFDISTKELATFSQSGGQFFGIHASNDGRVMIFAGGVPLKRAGKIVGAFGVSGGSGEQDHAVAEAGAAVPQLHSGVGCEMQSDKTLIAAMLKGNEAAFRTFFENYFPRVYRFALLRLHGDVEAAKDVVQSTLIKAVRGLAGFR